MELKAAKNPGPKAALRRVMLARRKAHDPALAERRSRLAQEFILTSPSWREASCVGLYMPVNGEAGTGLLLAAAFATGKRVYLPKITGPGSMEFLRCAKTDGLRAGPMGILEPEAAADRAQRLDLVIMPGLAFDRQGMRLGYGGAYYDRYFGCHHCATAIGLCFAFQIVPALPAETWDLPVNAVCSEEGLYWL